MVKRGSRDYEKRKALLLQALARLQAIEPSVTAKVQKMQERLESGFFTLAIMGQVKRGKTTLVNALLGRDILPVAALPLTSVITIIRFGSKARMTVIFLDGRKKEITERRISEYITEEKNPKNEKMVKRLEIEYPADFLKYGVLIADTPGIGSIHMHNTEITHQFLPEMDATVFVLSPDPPITEAECAFLLESSRFASKFFFVLTKSDYLSGQELSPVLDFDRKVIAEKMGLEQKETTLFSLSAKKALEAKQTGNERALQMSGLPAFENALERFVVSRKGELVLRSSASKAAYLAQELLNQLLIEKSSLDASAGELRARVARFDEEMKKVAALKENVEDMVDVEQGKIMELLDADLEILKDAAQRQISSEIREYSKSLKDRDNRQFSSTIDEFRSERVLALLGSWRDSEEGKISREFSARMAKYSGAVDEINRTVEAVAAGIFKARIQNRKIEEQLVLESDFYFKFSSEEGRWSPDLELLLPRAIFRRRKKSKIVEEVYSDVDCNCGRMRYDFLRRLQKSSDAFKLQLGSRVEELISGMREAGRRSIGTREKGERETAGRLAEIEMEISGLRKILESCEKIRRCSR